MKKKQKGAKMAKKRSQKSDFSDQGCPTIANGGSARVVIWDFDN